MYSNGTEIYLKSNMDRFIEFDINLIRYNLKL